MYGDQPLKAEQATDRHVVIPDIHGESQLLERVVDMYIDEEDVGFVLLGDTLDRNGVLNDPEKGVFKTIDIVKSLGRRAVTAIGNHEWHLLASMYAADEESRKVSARRWLGLNDKDGVERNVLSSYDIDRTGKKPVEVATELRTAMSQLGHLAVITSTTPYYETDSFIAVHAGLDPDTSWEKQREQLNETAGAMKEGIFNYRPPQWFSIELAVNTQKNRHTHKTVLSGHAHKLQHEERGRLLAGCLPERSLHGGTKIRLASWLDQPNPDPFLYVWQDWNRKVVPIPTYDYQYEASAAD